MRKLLLIAIFLALMTLFILNASLPGRSVEGCPVGCADSGARTAGPLRIVSLNMLHGFPSFTHLLLRLNLIVDEIERLDADVVLLQEVPWTVRTGYAADFLARQLNYNYLYYRANGNHHLIFFEEGEAILSRFPLKDPLFTELLPKLELFESRVSLGANVITPWGEVMVFVTHLTDKDSIVRGSQAESLRRFVETHRVGPAVVAGDFNSQEDSPQITALASIWADTYRLIHPEEQGLTCCIDNLSDGPGETLEECIDYIFLLPGNWKLVNSERVFDQPFAVAGGWQWASDHIGLMVEIEP